MNEGAGRAFEVLAMLRGRIRRLVYSFAASAYPRPVSRDETAAAAGIDRKLAAFHLDRLAQAGLLDVSHRRLSGRSGPGAGRPSKLYRRSQAKIELSIPRRDYALAGELMVDALRRVDAGEAIRTAARTFGAALGEAAARRAGPGAGQIRRQEELWRGLAEHGYEPARVDGRDVRLCNCPFDSLASRYPDVLCEMNLALVDAATQASGVDGEWRAELVPEAGFCCVTLRAIAVS